MLRRVGEAGAALAELGVPGRTSCGTSSISPARRLPLLGRRRRAAPRSASSRPSAPSNSLRISISSSLRKARSRMLRIASAWTSVSSKRAHHHRLRLVLLADDADHLVEVEIGDQIAAEHFQPLGRSRRAGSCERRTSTSWRWSSHSLQHLASATARSAPCPRDSTFMLSGKRAFELGQLEQRFHHQRRDRPCGSSARARRGCPRRSRRARRRAAAACGRSSSSAIFSISRPSAPDREFR